MLYHTSMILLHRPPRALFRDPRIAISEDVKICYESLEAVTRLLGSYSRTYQYSPLPITFVHILATTASVILMKRYIEDLSWDDPIISKPLDLVSDAIDGISRTWPCATQVRGVISSARNASSKDAASTSSPESLNFNFIPGLVGNGDAHHVDADLDFELDDVDLGYLMHDDFLDSAFQWNV